MTISFAVFATLAFTVFATPSFTENETRFCHPSNNKHALLSVAKKGGKNLHYQCCITSKGHPSLYRNHKSQITNNNKHHVE